MIITTLISFYASCLQSQRRGIIRYNDSPRLASPPTKENNPPLLDDWRIARNKRNRQTERNVSTKYGEYSFSFADTRSFYADLLTIVFENEFSFTPYRENFSRNSIFPSLFFSLSFPLSAMLVFCIDSEWSTTCFKRDGERDKLEIGLSRHRHAYTSGRRIQNVLRIVVCLIS